MLNSSGVDDGLHDLGQEEYLRNVGRTCVTSPEFASS
jgi:hypothetical protein